MKAMPSLYRISNALYGSAFGDAWGYREEFKSFDQIVNDQPEFPIHEALITDDTQMALAGMRAILDNWSAIQIFEENLDTPEVIRHVRLVFAYDFMTWMIDPRNNRAPGNACMKALRILRSTNVVTGLEGTQLDSKGCGANMRNPWFGLLPLKEETIIRLSILQAEVTHSHPLALSSAVLTALATKAIFEGKIKLGNGRGSLFEYISAKTFSLLESEHSSPATFNKRYVDGLQMLNTYLNSSKRNVLRFMDAPETENPCELLKAEGWIAEEALLVAIAIADKHGASLTESLKRTVYTSGDSDSMAAIVGTFVGASFDKDVLPEGWDEALEPEYKADIDGDVTSIYSLWQNPDQ